MPEHTKQYKFTHNTRFDFSTSYTKDDSIRYLMGDLQGQLREDVQYAHYPDDHYEPSYSEILELQQEEAQAAFVEARILRKLRQKGKHDADDEEVTDEQFAALESELNRTTEQLALYHKYLCDIVDELAKGNQSELHIDQSNTKNADYPYITLNSLKAWEKNKPPEPVATPPKKPPRAKMLQQADAILAAIGQLGYKPERLPQTIKGQPGVRAEVWTPLKDKALENGELLFKNKKVFDNAWQKLRDDKLTREVPTL